MRIFPSRGLESRIRSSLKAKLFEEFILKPESGNQNLLTTNHLMMEDNPKYFRMYASGNFNGDHSMLGQLYPRIKEELEMCH